MLKKAERKKFIREKMKGLYCITAEKYSKGRTNIEVVKEMLSAGIKLIQYREKEKPLRAQYHDCLEIRKLTNEAGALLIVNDYVDLALTVNADGVHLGQDDLPIEVVRKLTGDDFIIGLSTHSPQQAEAAEKKGVDYIGVGPIFKTFTKKGVCAPVGLEYLSYVVKNIKIPFAAIGGIKESNLSMVYKHGAECVCLITEIVGASNIQKKIYDIRRKIISTTKGGEKNDFNGQS